MNVVFSQHTNYCTRLLQCLCRATISVRGVSTSHKPDDTTATQPMVWDEYFKNTPKEEKTKEAFLKCIEIFKKTYGKRGGGQIEFIESALKHMETYNLHKDLDIYKALLQVFPEDIYIPKNYYQQIFIHYPQHQECAVDVLDEMEWNGVQPDKELHEIMKRRFGPWNYSTLKVKRQLYWLPKLKHTNKYLDRRMVENMKLLDVELASIALKMICRDAGTQITSFKAPFANAPTGMNWIVSGQSPLQKKLIASFPYTCTCYVDGPFRIYVRDHLLHYIVLNAPPELEEDEEFLNLKDAHNVTSAAELHKRLYGHYRSINLHQQSDQTILALAILGLNTHDYASAWLDHLHEENKNLSKISILFRLKQIQKSLVFKFTSDNG